MLFQGLKKPFYVLDENKMYNGDIRKGDEIYGKRCFEQIVGNT